MSDLSINLDGGVLSITLTRPDKKNALSNAMYREIAAALDKAGTDPAVRAVLLRGEGDAFCAGNDLADFAAVAMGAVDPSELAAFVLLGALTRLDKPLVAGVRGFAVGIGTTMLLHCDLVYVAEDAKLSMPFASLALTPEAASSILAPQRIGHVRAFAMFALGERVDGKTAAAWGLANAALPAAEVDTAALSAAQALAKQPAGALAAAKRLMRNSAELDAIILREAEVFAAQLKTPEAREAFTAFAERRPPDFTRLG
jgi:enoyl-CoA hydratase/carnithine racemase